MRSRFFWKVAIPQIAILIVIFFTVGSYLSKSLINYYKEQFFAGLRTDVALLVLDLQDSELIYDSIKANTFVKETASILSGRVTLIDPNGTVLAESEANPDLLENHATRPEFIIAMGGETSTVTRFSETFLKEYVYIAAPVYDVGSNQIEAILRIAIPLNSIESEENSIINDVVLITIVSTIILIAMDLSLLFLLTKPIMRITKRIQNDRNIGPIKFGEKKDEILTLEKAFMQYDLLYSQKLKELEIDKEELNTILNTITDGLIITDKEGQVELTNQAANILFQRNPSDNRNLVNLVRDDQIFRIWEKCITQRTKVSELITLPAQGKTLNIVIIPLRTGNDHRFLLMVKDVSELKKLHNLRQEFISNISHELRTPIASIKALSETINNVPMREHTTRQKFFSLMESEIDNVSHLVEELLELSRIESGQVPFNFSAINPNMLTHDAHERMKFQADRAKVKLILGKADLPDVICDPQRIHTVLINLIHNAIKFTPPGGFIEITTRQDENSIIFSIKDSGVGISSENLDRIFERFYKTEPSRATAGTGLGLSISKHIIEVHLGKIWVESDGVSGSIFYFSLPTTTRNS